MLLVLLNWVSHIIRFGQWLPVHIRQSWFTSSNVENVSIPDHPVDPLHVPLKEHPLPVQGVRVILILSVKLTVARAQWKLTHNDPLVPLWLKGSIFPTSSAPYFLQSSEIFIIHYPTHRLVAGNRFLAQITLSLQQTVQWGCWPTSQTHIERLFTSHFNWKIFMLRVSFANRSCIRFALLVGRIPVGPYNLIKLKTHRKQ